MNNSSSSPPTAVISSSSSPPLLTSSSNNTKTITSTNNTVTSPSPSSSSSATKTTTDKTLTPNSQSTNNLPVKKKCAKDFKFIGLIGEGSFSMVALAVDINTKQKYAIKICEKRQLLKEKKDKAIMREKDILNLLDLHSSPYFIRLHFSFQDAYRLFFGLSFARGGELLTYINKLSGFNEECTRFYSAQILLALEYLHKLGIIHRDLKPENLLLNEKLHIQITDFGSAFLGSTTSIKPYNCDSNQRKRITSSRSKEAIKNGLTESDKNDPEEEDEAEKKEHVNDNDNDKETDDNDGIENKEISKDEINSSEDESKRLKQSRREQNDKRNSRSNSFVGTAQYVSPEMLKYKNAFTSSDLWAYGCIIYQMLVGNPPFNDATDFLIFQKILAVNLTFPEDKINPQAKDLIQSLLIVDPCERLGASDDFTLGSYPSIRAHPFFTELSQPPKVIVTNRMQKSPPILSSTSTTTRKTTTTSSPSPPTTTTTTTIGKIKPTMSPPPLSSNHHGSGFYSQSTSYPQTRWSTLYLEESPLTRYLDREDYLLESRISCLNYDDIEPGLHEGLLLGLGLSDNPKKVDLPFDKVDSTLSPSSSSASSSQKTGYNNSISTTSNRSENNYSSRNDDKNSSSQKENSRSNSNPERVKKKGLFGLKWFKH
ncbi:3-phosphoinositide-dependent protein kinase 1-like [Panonychus citri]|uniref:3-phosphoinositide-dependent protein kinase 1-like n=1 Tax=Panonychus citri TaxID=50023 RepID=UPI002307DAE1|nr:3-phosphoinositide-dependent protein kinase 1-like [Panonychus citri]